MDCTSKTVNFKTFINIQYIYNLGLYVGNCDINILHKFYIKKLSFDRINCRPYQRLIPNPKSEVITFFKSCICFTCYCEENIKASTNFVNFYKIQTCEAGVALDRGGTATPGWDSHSTQPLWILTIPSNMMRLDVVEGDIDVSFF